MKSNNVSIKEVLKAVNELLILGLDGACIDLSNGVCIDYREGQINIVK